MSAPQGWLTKAARGVSLTLRGMCTLKVCKWRPAATRGESMQTVRCDVLTQTFRLCPSFCGNKTERSECMLSHLCGARGKKPQNKAELAVQTY